MNEAAEVLRQRLSQRGAALETATRDARRISNLRLGVFALALAVGWLAFGERAISALWLLPVAGAFVALVLAHDAARRRRLRAERAREHYELALARMEHRIAGRGRDGERYLDPEHPYAMHLDLFGRGSLFELLSRAQTRAGEDRLAAWLLAPAAPEELRARHAAVNELRGNLDLREDLAVLGPEIRHGVHPEPLLKWGRAPVRFTGGALRAAAAVLAALSTCAVAAALAGATSWAPALVAIAAQSLFAASLRSRVSGVLGEIEAPSRDLAQLSALVDRVERESFAAPLLASLRGALETQGVPASRDLARLHRLVTTLDWRRNQLFAPIAPLLLWGTQHAFALEAWRSRCGGHLEGWLDALGELEALCDLAAHAWEHPADPFPEIAETGPVFDARGLGHPLLADASCVRNDLSLDADHALVVVSGSNMSGKSTLLRSVGSNVVLALAGAPVRAHGLRVSPLSLGASLRVQDSLQEGASRFFAELLCLKRAVQLCEGPRPVLFLLDEILQGTNSHDRGIGASALVRGLLARGAMGLVTTHDLALTAMVDELAPRARNAHFEDELREGELHFDYRLREGVVKRSNALALMRSVGLELDAVPT
ncbi:MAG: DNA mismatch repair protein MutS [Deltaproteobacteria bacterium]|nr:DNA mismatch repair protein MutS [Deltaproteobacteria bacterium]